MSNFVKELLLKVTPAMTVGFNLILPGTILLVFNHVAQEGTIWLAYDAANKFMTDTVAEIQPDLDLSEESDALFELEDLVMAMYAMRLCNTMSLYWSSDKKISSSTFAGYTHCIDFRALDVDLYN